LIITKAIQKQLKKYGHEPVPFRDIQDEIFDMVKPENPYKITLADLINCGQGEVVVNILIDLNGFWTHENRETLVTESSAAAAAAAAAAASQMSVPATPPNELIDASNADLDKLMDEKLTPISSSSNDDLLSEEENLISSEM
jgi:hypothetical protein